MSDWTERPNLAAEPLVEAMSLVSDGVVILDEWGRVVYQNHAAEEYHESLHGDEAVSEYLQNTGHCAWGLVNPFHRGAAVETPFELAKQGRFERDFLIMTDKSVLIIATYSGKPLLNKEGKPGLFVLVIKNVRKIVKE
jgi:hypothetical protein